MKRFLPLLYSLLLACSVLAPSGVAQKQTAPRPQGIWFDFPEQVAKNTLLVTRFPSGWTQPPNRVFIQGFGVPFTASVADGMKRFTNGGFTHAERPQFVNLLNLPISKRFIMARDADAQGQAQTWASQLPDSDPRKTHVQAYGNNRAVTSTDYSIYRELGKRTYYAVKGQGLGLIGFDIEAFADGTPVEVQHQFQAAANLGMGDGIAADNPACKIFQYGGSLANVVNYTKSRQDDDIYMRVPGPDWQGAGSKFDINASPIAIYYRQSGAFVGRDQYARRTWGKMSLFQHNGDGSIKFDGTTGRPLFVVTPTGTMSVTNFGKTCLTAGYESKAWLEMWYEEVDKEIADWSFYTNTNTNTYDGKYGTTGVPMPYPKGSGDIRAGLELLKLCGWYRDDTESEAMYNPYSGKSEEPPNSNRRPLNPEAIRFQLLIRSLLYHGNILWSDKSWMNYQQGKTFLKEGGGQYVEQEPLAMGQWEHMIAGHYQASYFPNYFTLMDQGKLDFIIPKRGILKGNDAVGEREENKPIVWLMKENGGRQVFGLWAYPIQDMNNAAHNMTIKTWIVLDNGTTSGSWELLCKDRATGYDGWRIPAGFESARAENFRFQFTSPITGLTFTWTGNYNVPFTGANPTPPATISRTLITQAVHIPFTQPVELASAWSPLRGIVLGMAN